MGKTDIPFSELLVMRDFADKKVHTAAQFSNRPSLTYWRGILSGIDEEITMRLFLFNKPEKELNKQP